MTETNRFMGDIRTAYESGDVETLAIMASRNAAHVVDLRDRLARVERQAFFRDELEAQGYEVPEGVIAWEKSGPVARNPGARKWLGTSGRMMYTAVDLLPDEPGPCRRAILD